MQVIRGTAASGNSFVGRVRQAGARVAVDVEWAQPPSAADIEQANRVLSELTGGQLFGLLWSDNDAKRRVLADEFLEGGSKN